MKYLLLSLLVITSISCNQKSDDNTSNPAPAPNTPADDPSNGGAAVADLSGTWSKPCASAGTQGHRHSLITVQADNVQLQELLFQNNSSCQGTPDLDARANFSYNIPVYTAGQLNNMDLRLKQVLAKINSTNGITLANSASLCGFNDWQLGVEKDVTGRNCIVSMPNAGEPFYQIFRVSSRDLYVGKITGDRTGRTPEARPNELEEIPFTR